MAKLIDQYASYLLVNAVKTQQLEGIYRHTVAVTEAADDAAPETHPELYSAFLQVAPASDLRPILLKFQKMARKHLGLMDISVVSASPLTDLQNAAVEQKLKSEYGGKISIVTSVDPSLLGGLRIIAGHDVIDNSIKKRLADMKSNVYKGVYFKKC